MAIDKLVEQMAQAGNKGESSGIGRHSRLLIVSAVAVGIVVSLLALVGVIILGSKFGLF